jgi:hypothetical protein
VSEAPTSRVCLISPPVLNQVGQRSTIFCSFAPVPYSSGRRLGVPREPRGTDRCFKILCSRCLKLDGFNNIGDRDLLAVLECRLRPQNVSFAEVGENFLRIAQHRDIVHYDYAYIAVRNSAITTARTISDLWHFARADF